MSPPAGPARLEAWGHRDERHPLARRGRAPDYDPPHLVAWAAGATTGRALCGKEVAPLRLEPTGTATIAGVPLCPACARAVAPLRRVRSTAAPARPRTPPTRPLW